jgi:aspartate/methionine/tyrosine aminotransferase
MRLRKLIILTDEVYEHMCYSGNEHIRVGAYKQMWDRTITMFTASKVFSCSGWRIGWAIGPAKLVEPLMAAQTWLCLGIHRPTQNAMAKALEYVKTTPYEDGKLYYDWMRDILEKKRDRLVKTLRNCWLKIRVFNPEGGFFIMVDITESIPMIPSEYYYKEGSEKKEGKEYDYSADYAFVRWIADKYRIVCIPCFPFYDQSHTTNPKEYRGSHLVRFALCKNDETLELVEKILGKE